jgi:hypothetical protein
VSECDHEVTIMRGPWPLEDCGTLGGKIQWVQGAPYKYFLLTFDVFSTVHHGIELFH